MPRINVEATDLQLLKKYVVGENISGNFPDVGVSPKTPENISDDASTNLVTNNGTLKGCSLPMENQNNNSSDGIPQNTSLQNEIYSNDALTNGTFPNGTFLDCAFPSDEVSDDASHNVTTFEDVFSGSDLPQSTLKDGKYAFIQMKFTLTSSGRRCLNVFAKSMPVLRHSTSVALVSYTLSIF